MMVMELMATTRSRHVAEGPAIAVTRSCRAGNGGDDGDDGHDTWGRGSGGTSALPQKLVGKLCRLLRKRDALFHRPLSKDVLDENGKLLRHSGVWEELSSSATASLSLFFGAQVHWEYVRAYVLQPQPLGPV